MGTYACFVGSAPKPYRRPVEIGPQAAVESGKVSSNWAFIAHIFKKYRLSTCFPRSVTRVLAAVQPGIAVPPFPSLLPARPGVEIVRMS